MKKHIFLSLLIASTAFTQAMEKESSYSYNQSSHEPEWIQTIRKEKNKFEEQLIDNTYNQNHLNYDPTLILSRFWRDDFNHIDFFRTCYYKSYHETNIFNFKLSHDLLYTYKDTQIDGYSSLSAAILAKNMSHNEKLKFIQDLMHLDFKPTQKDIQLAELYVYDSHKMNAYKDILLHVLQNNPNSHWSLLPYDIRKQIVRLLVQFFTKDMWLLCAQSETYYIANGVIKTI